MDFSKMNQSELKFFKLISDARNVNFNLEAITKKDPVKQEEKRKILKVVRKIISDNEMVEAGYLLYKKHRIIKFTMKFLLNYYIKCFSKNSNQVDILFD